MSEDGFKAHCAACAAIERCKHAFGKYWIEKSSGGVGCNWPVEGAQGATALCPEKEEPWRGTPFRGPVKAFSGRTMKQGELL